MKAIMKYPGSKWGTAEWIISHFPKHHSYVEPFFGSGGVFFNKPRSDIETINDLDGDVVNLFRWIKNDPEKLAHEIYFTPYSREVYEAAYQKEPEDSLDTDKPPIIQITGEFGALSKMLSFAMSVMIEKAVDDTGDRTEIEKHFREITELAIMTSRI